MSIPQKWIVGLVKSLFVSRDDKELMIGFVSASAFAFSIVVYRRYTN